MKRIVIIMAAVLAVLGLGAFGAASASSAPAKAPACSSSLLTWFAPQGSGFAGGAGYVVEFSNIGSATCTVTGYPSVELTENGKQVGLKSTTFGAAPATVTLKPGQTSHIVLLITDAGAICKPVPTNGLSVQPPGKAQAGDFALVAFGACRGVSTTRVDAINPGTGVPYYTIH